MTRPQLLEARRAAEGMIEALPNPIFFKGTEGRYRGVNKAWESSSASTARSVHRQASR